MMPDGTDDFIYKIMHADGDDGEQVNIDMANVYEYNVNGQILINATGPGSCSPIKLRCSRLHVKY